MKLNVQVFNINNKAIEKDWILLPKKARTHFAMEVKWAKKKTINVTNDIVKLSAYCAHQPNSTGFLCVFGVKSKIDKISLTHKGNIAERGNRVIAEFGATKYGCRIYELVKPLL